MRADDLLQECFKRTKMLRADLYAMDEFDKARNSASTPDGVKLFWYMWRPWNMFDLETPFGSLPALDNDLEAKVLKWLTRLERECRVPYVPDSDDPPDLFNSKPVHLRGCCFSTEASKKGWILRRCDINIE